eukprot:895530-Rhodomonas_salina.3
MSCARPAKPYLSPAHRIPSARPADERIGHSRAVWRWEGTGHSIGCVGGYHTYHRVCGNCIGAGYDGTGHNIGCVYEGTGHCIGRGYDGTGHCIRCAYEGTGHCIRCVGRYRTRECTAKEHARRA